MSAIEKTGAVVKTGGATASPPAVFEKAIRAAFAEQYPPKYTRQYSIVPGTLSVGYPRNGQVNFTFTAQVSHGGFTGSEVVGQVKFSGLYDLRNKAVSFIEGQL